MALRELVDRFRDLGGEFLRHYPGPFLLEHDPAKEALALEVVFSPSLSNSPLVVGRSSRVNLRIPSNEVSSQHAELMPPFKSADPWRVVDVGSTNGTTLNGQQLRPNTPYDLHDEDVIQFGPHSQFRFLRGRTLRGYVAELAGGGADGARSLSRPPARRPKRPARGRPPQRPPKQPKRRPPARPPTRRPAAKRPPPPRRQPPPESPLRRQAGAPASKADAAPAEEVVAHSFPRRGRSAPVAAVPQPAGEPPVEPEQDDGFRLEDFPEPRSDMELADVQALLTSARERQASDVHLMVDMPPVFRVNGELTPLDQAPLSADDLEAMFRLITSRDQQEAYYRSGDLDTCIEVGPQRYRTNICRHRSGSALTFRVVPGSIPSLEELGIPTAAQELSDFAQGLVLITGPLGAGKTTTMFSLVNQVNHDRPDHIITIEDPIEFMLPPAKCQVSQRQLGLHTESFAAALHGALREDPDIIVIGDLRDYETANLAITAAETGHLVFASMATTNATKTIDKLIDLFPAEEQAATRIVVSESLRGILCQHLLPGTEGQRAVAVELVFNSIAVSNIIRDGNTNALKNAMQTGRKVGMRSLDHSVQELLRAKRITSETAETVLSE